MTTPTLRLLDWARTQCSEVLNSVSPGRRLTGILDGRRHSGDPYITRPVEVALILTEQDAAPETVVTAVLHDVLGAERPRSLA